MLPSASDDGRVSRASLALLSLSGEASNTTAPPPWLVGVLINSGAIPYSFLCQRTVPCRSLGHVLDLVAGRERVPGGWPRSRRRVGGRPTPHAAVSWSRNDCTILVEPSERIAPMRDFLLA